MPGPVPASFAIDPGAAGARQIEPGLWRLRLPTAWETISHVNAYALDRGDGTLILVDCGTTGDPTCLAGLEHALAEAGGHTLADVSVLVATHIHSDHIGPAATIVERTGAELWTHPDDDHFYDALRDPEAVRTARMRRARAEGVPAERMDPFSSTNEECKGADALVAPDRELRDGDVVDSALGPWTVLETPGHSPSHICLVQPDRRIAISGDLICAVFAPWIDYGCSHDPYTEHVAALDALEQAGPLRLSLPGHGRPIADTPAAIAIARDGFRERLAQTRAALALGPASAYELTERIFGREPDYEAVCHMTEVLAYLRHLRLTGDVVRDETPDGRLIHRLADTMPAPGGPR